MMMQLKFLDFQILVVQKTQDPKNKKVNLDKKTCNFTIWFNKKK